MFCLGTVLFCGAKSFRLRNSEDVYIYVEQGGKPVVNTALEILKKDIRAVLNADLRYAAEIGDAQIIVVSDSIWGRESFDLKVGKDGKLYIQGGDSYGMAYGMLELSRLLGVSPWEWWADALPEKQTCLVLDSGFQLYQSPAVAYRGIFVNDEDWGLMPWSSQTYEPENTGGVIGPKTCARIFELLLRLRANTYWPAMHECTYPFFLTEGNREMAERYGIYIGGSHCEPMACSTAVEWGIRGEGAYDYVHNAENVRNFWKERLQEVKGQEIVYTIGMRGVHDGKMQGAKTVEEQKRVLQQVIADQRELLYTYVDQDLQQVPQVFIPYKEVQDIYNAGLEVPEDVTLMWCDDNYGYIRHFPTEEERNRKGGNGLYYHISYWGRPHDYLWLCTFSPWLLYQQLTTAYERGIQKMWILNVGDIKPAEYQIELFMDMAWNIGDVKRKGVDLHLKDFLSREFGARASRQLFSLMVEHYRLAWIRRPEFMGGTRTEERNREYWSAVKDLPWADEYITDRISSYQRLSDAVESIATTIAPNRRDCFYQIVKYPIQGAAQMNFKLLYAQQARNTTSYRNKELWEASDMAYDSIVSLTHRYNQGISNKGKWNGIMDMSPRNLSVFGRVSRDFSEDTVGSDARNPYYLSKRYNATDGIVSSRDATFPLHLGYENGAVELCKGESLTFRFEEVADSVMVEFRLVPTHPIDGESLCFMASLDGMHSSPVAYETKGRSEEWKLNVLRSQSLRRISLPLGDKRKHTLVFTALDDGVILDQVYIYAKH